MGFVMRGTYMKTDYIKQDDLSVDILKLPCLPTCQSFHPNEVQQQRVNLIYVTNKTGS